MTTFLRSILFGLLALCPGVALADTGVLIWDANTESDMAGYKVYQSTVSGVYGAPVATLGLVTTHTLTLPALTVDTRYFYTITAYDLSGNESGKSNEVSKLALVAPAMPVLTMTALSPTSIRITWPTVLDVAGLPTLIDIRLTTAPINWGSAPSTPCIASPCTVTGLLPNTSYAGQGVTWRTNSTGGKVFSGVGPVATVTTPQVDLAPAAPVGVSVR